MATTQSTRAPSSIILALLLSLASVGAVLFTPAIPAMSHYFAVPISRIELSIMLFILGYALGPLFYGPLANRYGRKPALYIGISIAIIGTVMCLLASPTHWFSLFIAGRFFAALGASAGMPIVITMINDYYSPAKARKIFPLLVIAFSVLPYLGTFAGGQLTSHFNWQACFYFLAAYNVVILLLVMRLPETSKQLHHNAIHPRQIWQRYRSALVNRNLLLFACIAGMSGGAINYLFSSFAPVIIIHQLHVSPANFGLLNLITAGGYFIGNIVASHIASYLSEQKTMLIGSLAILLGVIGALLMPIMHWQQPWFLFTTMSLAFFGIPLQFTNAIHLASNQLEDKSNASAATSFIVMIGALLGVSLGTLGSQHPQWSMPILDLILWGIALTCLIVAGYKRSSPTQKTPLNYAMESAKRSQ